MSRNYVPCRMIMPKARYSIQTSTDGKTWTTHVWAKKEDMACAAYVATNAPHVRLMRHFDITSKVIMSKECT